MITDYSFLLSLYIKEKPDFLRKCLESLYSQTVPPAETIIVFDGPIGKKLIEAVEEWKEKLNIVVIKLEENRGLGVALNIGLSHCNNNIVARVDTDDIYSPVRMENQLRFLAENPDYVIVGSNVVEFQDDQSDWRRIKRVPESKTEIKEYIKKRNPFNHMSVVFKRDFILSLGGYKHHPFMEDYNLWVRAVQSDCNLYNIQENLVYVRIGKNNEMVGRRKGIEYIESEYKLFKIITSTKINSPLKGFLVFILRSTTRLMPISLLSKIYERLRRDKNPADKT